MTAEAGIGAARDCVFGAPLEGWPSPEWEKDDKAGLPLLGSALVAKVRSSGKSARMPVLPRAICGAMLVAVVLVCMLWLVGNGKSL